MNQVQNCSTIYPQEGNTKNKVVSLTLKRKYIAVNSNSELKGVSIETYSNNKSRGVITFLPLISLSAPNKKQAVIVSQLTYNTGEEAEILIREGLMCSWELGYHVAFARNNESQFRNLGFQKISAGIYDINSVQNEVLIYELSWNGKTMISNKFTTLNS